MVEVLGGGDLVDESVVHDGDSVGEGKGFFLSVGNVNGCGC